MTCFKVLARLLTRAALVLTGQSKRNHYRIPSMWDRETNRPPKKRQPSVPRYRRPGRRISYREARESELIWNAIGEYYQDGDEIRMFASLPGAWKQRGGYLGISLVRGRRVVIEKMLMRS